MRSTLYASRRDTIGRSVKYEAHIRGFKGVNVTCRMIFFFSDAKTGDNENGQYH